MDREELKQKLQARITGEKAEAEWARTLERGVETWLSQRLDVVLPRAAIEPLVREIFTPDRLAELVRPGFGELLKANAAAMSKDQAPLGRWVPQDAQHLIEKIADRPGLVNPVWVRAMIKERAVEEVLSDTLYASIRDFSTLVPRMILNALPTGKLGLFGGAVGIGTKIAEEIEKRLEPEIKSFLAGGSKKALDRAADFTVAHLDDPVSREFRKNTLRFLLSRPVAEHAKPLSAEVMADVATVAEKISRHIAASPESAKIVGEVIDRIEADYGALTVKQALEKIGIRLPPPYAVWAAATWPGLKLILSADSTREVISTLIDDVMA